MKSFLPLPLPFSYVLFKKNIYIYIMQTFRFTIVVLMEFVSSFHMLSQLHRLHVLQIKAIQEWNVVQATLRQVSMRLSVPRSSSGETIHTQITQKIRNIKPERMSTGSTDPVIVVE